MTLLLNAEELNGQLSFAESISAIETGYREWAADRRLSLVRQRVRAPSGARLSIHPGSAPDVGLIGATVQCDLVRIDSDERQRHVGTGHYVRVIYSSETSQLEALVIGDIRTREFPTTHALFGMPTASTSALGTRLLSRPDSRRVTVIGAGTHARYHLAALREVRDIGEVTVYSRTFEKSADYARETSEVLGLDVKPTDNLEAAVRGADIVLCTTSSNVPVLDGAWLSPGTHVTSIVWSDVGLLASGQIRAKRRELDDGTLRRAAVIGTTSLDQFEHDQGADIYDGLIARVFPRERLVDIADLLTGVHPGRASSDDITVYKNSAFYGTADLHLTKLLLEKARTSGIGSEFNFGDTELVGR